MSETSEKNPFTYILNHLTEKDIRFIERELKGKNAPQLTREIWRLVVMSKLPPSEVVNRLLIAQMGQLRRLNVNTDVVLRVFKDLMIECCIMPRFDASIWYLEATNQMVPPYIARQRTHVLDEQAGRFIHSGK